MSNPIVHAKPFGSASRVAGFLILICLFWMSAPSQAEAATLNVRTDCRATGLGIFRDTEAINRCIARAAAMPGGGIVRFPSGIYQSASIHLMSHVTLQLDGGATILAASSGYDLPEPNPYDVYQDFAHSHFRDALIWGEHLTDIGIVGDGVIDGGFNLRTGSASNGQADKAISLKECDHVRLSGITIRRGGHIAILANGIDTMSVDGVRIQGDPNPELSTYNSRDGLNLINSAHVTVNNVDITGLPDDALALKSDFALGYTKPSTDIHVNQSRFSSLEDNALQFGSETCGDFSNISFADITIEGAGEAGIGITSIDGAVIEDIHYDRVNMSGVAVPIWIKTGNRARCPTPPRKGIIRNVTITDVTADGASSPSDDEFTSTISGLDGAPVENIIFTNVNLTVPGSHPASDAGIVPPENDSQNPSDQGKKPSYGWWLRHTQGVKFVDSTVEFAQEDGRPALIGMDAKNTQVNSLVFERGAASLYDLGFDGASTYFVDPIGTVSTTGAAARIQTLP